MGRIVKAAGSNGPIGMSSTPAAEEVAAILALARVEANRERAAAKDVAIVLARKMAEKIVGHAVAVDPEVMGDIAGHALEALKPCKEAVLLRLHPEDLARLEAERPDWLTEMAAERALRVVGDAAVGRHGCVVETATVRLDARLDVQLDALDRALRASGVGHG